MSKALEDAALQIVNLINDKRVSAAKGKESGKIKIKVFSSEGYHSSLKDYVEDAAKTVGVKVIWNKTRWHEIARNVYNATSIGEIE